MNFSSLDAISNNRSWVYVDDKYRFQISVPNTWVVMDGRGAGPYAIAAFGKSKYMNDDRYVGEWFIEMYDSSDWTIDSINSDIGLKKVSKQEIIIQGYPAIKVQGMTKGSPQSLNSIFLEKNGYIFEIFDGGSGLPDFDGFFNSFKFL